MISSSFWRERRVFLTGHTGFKGAWLALVLERLNARVTGYGLRPATTPALYDLVGAGETLCDVRGDVCDAALLDGALRASDPDIVIHMATRPPRGARPAVHAADIQAREEGDRIVIAAVESAPFVQAALVVSPDAQTSAVDFRVLAGDGARFHSVFCPDPVGGGDFAVVDPKYRPALHVLDALYGLLLLAETACGGESVIASDWTFAPSGETGARHAAGNVALGWSPLLSEAEAMEWTEKSAGSSTPARTCAPRRSVRSIAISASASA